MTYIFLMMWCWLLMIDSHGLALLVSTATLCVRMPPRMFSLIYLHFEFSTFSCTASRVSCFFERISLQSYSGWSCKGNARLFLHADATFTSLKSSLLTAHAMIISISVFLASISPHWLPAFSSVCCLLSEAACSPHCDKRCRTDIASMTYSLYFCLGFLFSH